MGTNIRPETSKKNEYYIPKHRYYELKHFVTQYRDFLKMRMNYQYGYQNPTPTDYIYVSRTNEYSDPTGDTALVIEKLTGYIDQISSVAEEVDPIIGPIILRNVVNGESYETSSKDIPCCKDSYYKLYRKFFYLLSQRH